MRFGTDYEETRRLPDGTRVRLRLLGPGDRAKLLAGFERLSDESRYARFFTAMPRLSETMLDRLLDTDGWKHLAIVAEAGDQPSATAGDHLDVIGHFGDRSVVPPHFDWLVTGTGFDHVRFEAVWTAVIDWLTAARPASPAGSAGSPP